MILLIYGGGGVAHEVYDLAIRNMPDRWEKIFFIDDFADEGSCYLSESIHFDSIINKFKGNMNELEGIVAIGEPKDREILYNKLISINIKIVSLIDKTASISPTAKIGAGSVICERALIQANVSVGNNVLIQPYSIVGHDTSIGNHSVFSVFSLLGGKTVLGERVFVGMHASIREKLIIEKNVIIGMGSMVFHDIKEGLTVVGNPAQITRGNEIHKVFREKNINKEKPKVKEMENLEKYIKAYEKIFEMDRDKIEDLKYQDIEEWDSVGHMLLIEEVERIFEIRMNAKDIMEFGSFKVGKEILKQNYHINF